MPIFSQKQAEEMRQDRAKVWDALYLSDNFQHQDKDIYTLAVEAIEERNALRAQKHDLEYRLEAQKETNRELAAIDDVGRVVHDLGIANTHLESYREFTLELANERAMLRRALAMIQRVSRICANPWVFPCKIIDKLVTSTFNGEFND